MSKHTREEIAKQFDLPERQSKIESLLREPEIYCICRSSDSTRFMIACDACEEWYHGDCVNITQSEANNIHHYYCQWCIEKDPSLEIEYKKKSSSGGSKKEKSLKTEGKAAGRGKKTEKAYAEEKPEKVKGCGSCTGCVNRRDCGRCENCKKNKKKDSEKSKKKTCVKRICVDTLKKEEKSSHKSKKEESTTILTNKQLNIADEDDWKPPVTTSSGAAAAVKKPKPARRSKKKVESKSRKQYTPTRESDISGSSSEDESQGEDPKQCFWYECLNAARSGSKYCSDECGIRLATDRILRLLPSRLQEWNLTPSIAEEKNKKDLEGIRKKQQDCRKAIEQLERSRAGLDEHIEKYQSININPDNADDEHEEEEGFVPCVTCGHEVSVKTCIKHMERCYNKYESQTSFGSAFKTELEGIPIFCDFFHPINRTYCKRLRVLCPEHSKEPKIREAAICGYPMIRNVTGPTDNICKISKKKCNRHYSWEKLRRAEIDLEKVRFWMKLDDLLLQERQCKQALTDRAGVLGLLLHSTFDHEIRDKLQLQMAQAEIKEEQQEIKVEPSSEVDMDFAEFEMSEQPTKSRHHRQSQPKASSSQEEEMTASKMFKMKNM